MARPIVADLFEETAAGVQLVAGRDKASATLVFPIPVGPERARFDRVLLPTEGVLWSWTVQRFAPKDPYDGPGDETFAPYGVGYVQLGDALIVEGRITGSPDALRIGQAMRVVAEEYRDGIATYAFAPAGDGA